MNEEIIMKNAAVLHQDLYAYGNLKTQEKLLVVSGILMAFTYGFSIEELQGNQEINDGEILYNKIKKVIEEVDFDEENGKIIILEQFGFLTQTKVLNEVNIYLQKTPLKHFAEFLYEKIFLPYCGVCTEEDYIGRFYTEFMSYESSEGQTLGIILTPSHISSLFTDLLDVNASDIILDPCAGTAGFLIGGLKKALEKNKGKSTQEILNKHLCGFEVQHFMYTIAAINLIIRGCKKIHLHNQDFLNQDANEIRNMFHASIGMINPPYSLGTSANPKLYEINFVKHLLDSLEIKGRVAAIIPTSMMTGKTKEVKDIKKEILKNHTLEGVITMNPETFYGVDTQTVIAVFTAGIPHPKNKLSKFIDFRDDGYFVSPHIGLIKGDSSDEKKQYLLDVWNDRVEAHTKFCVKSTITEKDEWLHSYFYFKDEIPEKHIFEEYAEEYLAYRCSFILQEKTQLFEGQESFADLDRCEICDLNEKEWKPFVMTELFSVRGTKVTDPNTLIPNGPIPRICCAKSNNGIEDTYQNPPTEPGNVLTVDSATVGTVHYQQVPFSSSSHVEKLLLKESEMNVFLGLFLVSAISYAIKGKYNYGYKFSKARIKRQVIMLPVNDSGNADYIYMERYLKMIVSDKWKQFTKIF